MDEKIVNISRGRKLTPEEVAKYRQMRIEIEAEKPELIKMVKSRMAELRELAEVFPELKKAREEQGLSLADLQERTGIDRSALSKLETGQRANFTLDTALRYADAVGKRLLFTVADRSKLAGQP